MKLLFVNTLENLGGASKIAQQLIHVYRNSGHQVWLAVGEKQSHDSNVFSIAPVPPPPPNPKHPWFRLCMRASATLQPLNGKGWGMGRVQYILQQMATPRQTFRQIKDFGHEVFYSPKTWQLSNLVPNGFDLIHCHNLHGVGMSNGQSYFDLNALPKLSRQYPVVISLHDAWLLSGHCAHSFECDRWQTGCGHCPDLTIPPALLRDATNYNWQHKRRIYAKSKLYIATPCNWLQQRVEKSILAAGSVQSRVIPYGIDLDFFRPATNKQSVRATLGLPPNTRVLLCTGNYIRTSRWKDYHTMRMAMSQVAENLPNQKLLFLVLGLEDSPAEQVGNLEVRFMPHQSNQTVVQYYQAADIYLHAAKADTFPLSVLEALACGTPVIGTETGGIPEQVEHEVTGFLVAPRDAQSMASYIISLLLDENRLAGMGLNATRSAHKRFDLTRMVNDYLTWYKEILQEHDRLR